MKQGIRDFSEQGKAIVVEVKTVGPITEEDGYLTGLDLVGFHVNKYGYSYSVTERDAFKVGDIGVFIPAGQVVPEWPTYAWLSHSKKLPLRQSARIRVRKFFDFFSEGILLKTLPDADAGRSFPGGKLEPGVNIAGFMGVFPYKPGKAGKDYKLPEKQLVAFVGQMEDKGIHFHDDDEERDMLMVGPSSLISKQEAKTIKHNRNGIMNYLARREALKQMEPQLAAQAEAANKVYEKANEHAVDAIQPDLYCVVCGKNFESANVRNAEACPGCGSKVKPRYFAGDFDLKLNVEDIQFLAAAAQDVVKWAIESGSPVAETLRQEKNAIFTRIQNQLKA